MPCSGCTDLHAGLGLLYSDMPTCVLSYVQPQMSNGTGKGTSWQNQSVHKIYFSVQYLPSTYGDALGGPVVSSPDFGAQDSEFEPCSGQYSSHVSMTLQSTEPYHIDPSIGSKMTEIL